MKVLVCGGRLYGRLADIQPQSVILQQAERERVAREQRCFLYTMHEIHMKRRISEVIEGGARGADELAGNWARANRIELTVVRADWNAHGKAAGPIRNSEMLKLKPDVVVAFPGGRGTDDMTRRAEAAGVEVIKVKLHGSASDAGAEPKA